MEDAQDIDDGSLFGDDTSSNSESTYDGDGSSKRSDDDTDSDSDSSGSGSVPRDSIRDYLNQFFDLTRIYRAWKSSQDDKSKVGFTKDLEKLLDILESDKCDIDSIQLYHNNSELIIECHYKTPHSNNVRVVQYRIYLDDKISIEDEIKILEGKINKMNYIYEIAYLRDNLLNYQSLNGTDNIDTYLLEIDFSLVDNTIIDKIKTNRSSNPFEKDVYDKMLGLLRLKYTYDKQIDFLQNYKKLIYVQDELFGKYRTCKGDDISGDVSDRGVNKRVTVPNLELCLQYCQLRYADFLKSLNERHQELKLINHKNRNLRKAKMFDIIALEKQISSLKTIHKTLTNKYTRGDLVKVEIIPETGDVGDDFLGFVKSYNDKKNTTNISYCNKVKNEELDTEQCKDIKNATFPKDHAIELVVPIVDFLHYYRTTINNANNAIPLNFRDKHTPDISEEISYVDIEMSHPEEYVHTFEPNMVRSREFTIYNHTNHTMKVNDKSYPELKHALYSYLYENRSKVETDIAKLCSEGEDDLLDKIELFVTDFMERVRKEHPIINYNKNLENYVEDYIYRFLSFVCNSTSIKIKSHQVDDLRTQRDRENELESKRRKLELQLQAELEQQGDQEYKGRRRRTNHANRSSVGGLTGNMGGIKGIRNIGSTCFMNSVLQVFSNIMSIREYLFTLRRNKYLDTVRNPEYKNKYNIINRFVDILQELWKPGRYAVESGKVLPFRRLIKTKFSIGRQHDSGEFFLYLLDIIHEYLSEPLNLVIPNRPTVSVDILANGILSHNLDQNADNELLKSVYDSDQFIGTHRAALNKLKLYERKSIMSHLYSIYTMYIISTYDCEDIDGAGTVKIKYSTNFMLEMKPGIEGKPINIESLLRKYQEEEELEEENRVRSIKCGHDYTHKTMLLVDLPPILNIKINRHVYMGGVMEKNGTPVHMPLILDTEPLINEKMYIGTKSHRYNLKSIIWHMGDIGDRAEGFGHYFTWVKQNGKWVEFNDSNASSADIDTETINGQVYMKDGEHDGAQVHMVVYERQDLGIIKYEPVMQSEPEQEGVDVIDAKPEDVDEEPVVVIGAEPEDVDADPEDVVVADPEDVVVADPEQDTSYKLVDLLEMNPQEMTLEQRKQLQDKLRELRNRSKAEQGAENISDVETKLNYEDGLEVSGDSDDVSSSEDVTYDMVEVIIEYRKNPKKRVPILKGSKWFKDKSDDGKVYYMANDDTNEPISLYMVYQKSTSEDDGSDGKKIPVNNIIYYYDDNEEQKVYAYISNLRDGTMVKDIENGIFSGELKLATTNEMLKDNTQFSHDSSDKTFSFKLGKKQAQEIFYGANNNNFSKLRFTEESMYSVSKVRGATELYNIIRKYIPITIDLTLTDGTGNIGSDTAYLAPKFEKINTIEIDIKTFEVLKNNVEALELNNVNLINGNTLEQLEKLKQDIIIIDAPWGGKDYKKLKKMKLYMSGQEISELWLDNKDYAKLFIFKVPCNYDIESFKTTVGVKVDVYDYIKYKRCYYKFLVIYREGD
jgi:ubiquitin C-terminal hydrolase/16S rRNA G966 N2-methylase RsmD